MTTAKDVERDLDSLGATALRIKGQRDQLLSAAKTLVTEVIIGYENEHESGWPENAKMHQCEVCYNSAKRLREVIAKLQG